MSSLQALLIPNPMAPGIGDKPPTAESSTPQETMNEELARAARYLDAAIIAFSGGTLDEVCAQLQEAGDVLDALVSAVVLANAKPEADAIEQPLAMAAAA